MALIFLCESCKFGEKIFYSNCDNEFFLRDYFLLVHSVYRVKNFVNFGPVTPEKTGLICELFYDMAKTGTFSQISQDVQHRFLNLFTI